MEGTSLAGDSSAACWQASLAALRPRTRSSVKLGAGGALAALPAATFRVLGGMGLVCSQPITSFITVAIEEHLQSQRPSSAFFIQQPVSCCSILRFDTLRFASKIDRNSQLGLCLHQGSSPRVGTRYTMAYTVSRRQTNIHLYICSCFTSSSHCSLIQNLYARCWHNLYTWTTETVRIPQMTTAKIKQYKLIKLMKIFLC
jgi:hypothetical protein